MTFEYDGRHLMIDVTTPDLRFLINPEMGVSMIEDIIETIGMTMILPPVTVKFPHAVCEMTRVLEGLEKEGLGSCETAVDLRSKLAERKNEAYGYSTFAMIAESHLSLHTFPELGYASFDCYSCKWFDTDKVIEVMNHHFTTGNIAVQVATRRVPSETSESLI